VIGAQRVGFIAVTLAVVNGETHVHRRYMPYPDGSQP
jgi:hypothetical protein